mmetsp:Transcript_96037/g.215117  ORF Transcript_96037/g.215117 Transcript_96037/m.215117 type:complete len:300 (-) Transcript_96037:3137-4036(-)
MEVVVELDQRTHLAGEFTGRVEVEALDEDGQHPPRTPLFLGQLRKREAKQLEPQVEKTRVRGALAEFCAKGLVELQGSATLLARAGPPTALDTLEQRTVLQATSAQGCVDVLDGPCIRLAPTHEHCLRQSTRHDRAVPRREDERPVGMEAALVRIFDSNHRMYLLVLSRVHLEVHIDAEALRLMLRHLARLHEDHVLQARSIERPPGFVAPSHEHEIHEECTGRRREALKAVVPKQRPQLGAHSKLLAANAHLLWLPRPVHPCPDGWFGPAMGNRDREIVCGVRLGALQTLRAVHKRKL